MLKLITRNKQAVVEVQPPSGGCVLKRALAGKFDYNNLSAAFGRLCVETDRRDRRLQRTKSAAFGRLCVETIDGNGRVVSLIQPPSGGCVLKLFIQHNVAARPVSRLRAAVC